MKQSSFYFLQLQQPRHNYEKVIASQRGSPRQQRNRIGWWGQLRTVILQPLGSQGSFRSPGKAGKPRINKEIRRMSGSTTGILKRPVAILPILNCNTVCIIFNFMHREEFREAQHHQNIVCMHALKRSFCRQANKLSPM